MRVTFLTHYYPPEVGAPQARISGLAERLAAGGAAEVTVHTCFPHYPEGVVAAPYRNRLLLRERSGSVHVVRSAVYPAANRGFARRLANHLSFGASSLATAAFAGPADVVVVESPPLFTAAAGVAYAALKRAPLVINVADRWPASAVELGMLGPGPALRAAEALERLCYRRAAAVTVPTAGLVAALQELPEARGKVVHMPPSIELADFDSPSPKASRPAGGPLRVLYAGTVGLAHGLETLVRAAEIAGPGTVEVEVAGEGADAPRVRSLVERRRIANVRMLGRRPHSEVPGLYASADAAVVLLRDVPIFRAALPTKMLEAMAAGRAVVLSAAGEAARLIEERGAGVTVAPEDPIALAEAFAALAADRERLQRLGAEGRRCVAESFSRERRVREWQRLLGGVIEGSRLSPHARPERASGAPRRGG